jgi:hypothetical protein
MFPFIGQKVDADNDRTATLSHFAQLYIICYKLELDNYNRQGYFYITLDNRLPTMSIDKFAVEYVE